MSQAPPVSRAMIDAARKALGRPYMSEKTLSRAFLAMWEAWMAERLSSPPEPRLPPPPSPHRPPA